MVRKVSLLNINSVSMDSENQFTISVASTDNVIKNLIGGNEICLSDVKLSKQLVDIITKALNIEFLTRCFKCCYEGKVDL